MNTWECLQNINDSNGASASTAASSAALLSTFLAATTAPSSSASSNSSSNNAQSSANLKNKIEKFEPVTLSSTSSATEKSNTDNHNQSTNAHSLGSLKKARSGRNHAGAKYLASQYTKGINDISKKYYFD